MNLAYHDLTPPDTVVPATLKRLLGLGLNFCPTPSHIQPSHILQTYPFFQRTIRLKYLFERSDNKIGENMHLSSFARAARRAGGG